MATFLKNAPRSVLWFKQVHERNELEMKPPFQRNPVWTDKQKSYLIDSILNEYPVPEIYMQEIVSDKAEVKYIIVDGQQRIRAILEFVSNQFSIDAKDSPQWADLTFEELRPEEKKRIYEYDFIARYLPDIDDSQIRAIFGRLNRNNVVLNAQELRQATYWGPFIQTMNEIAENENWGKLDIFTSNDIKRMLDVEFVSELAIAVLNGHQNKKLTIEKYYQLYESEFEQRNFIKETFDSVLREFLSIIPQETNRWYKRTDFYTLFIVFAKHKDKLPLSIDKRNLAKSKLTAFGLQIDSMVSINKVEEETETMVSNHFAPNVLLYGAGIRASSDLGSRRRRDEALEAELVELWAE
ncbi:MAG: DUF262 domain-containing protein [Bacteroidetes bacterium]|nr:DUF262 domain-containing protein [Bacteroidota bacterium]